MPLGHIPIGDRFSKNSGAGAPFRPLVSINLTSRASIASRSWAFGSHRASRTRGPSRGWQQPLMIPLHAKTLHFQSPQHGTASLPASGGCDAGSVRQTRTRLCTYSLSMIKPPNFWFARLELGNGAIASAISSYFRERSESLTQRGTGSYHWPRGRHNTFEAEKVAPPLVSLGSLGFQGLRAPPQHNEAIAEPGLSCAPLITQTRYFVKFAGICQSSTEGRRCRFASRQ